MTNTPTCHPYLTTDNQGGKVDWHEGRINIRIAYNSEWQEMITADGTCGVNIFGKKKRLVDNIQWEWERERRTLQVKMCSLGFQKWPIEYIVDKTAKTSINFNFYINYIKGMC